MSGDPTPADRPALSNLLEPSLLDDPGPELEAMRASVRQQLFGEGTPAFRIDRFTVLHRLGAGGMGVVYLAHDPSLGRKVAIKLLRGEGARRSHAQARLQREARALASLSHPNVVVVHEVGVHEGQLYLVMEHVAGQTLRAWTRAHAADWRAIVAQYRAAGEGLAAAHRAGIIHRDFKPDNVLVDEDGRPRVLDFGLAAAEAEPRSDDERSWEDVDDVDLTKTGAILGTPSYMAPEQFLGVAVDARSDQFSFCVALWEALFEQRPFEGNSLAELRRAVIAGRRRQPPPRGRVPRAIVAALERGLAPDPAERFDTMSELLLALAEPRPSRLRAWISVGLASLTGLAVAALLSDDAPSEPDPRPPSARSEPPEPVASEPPAALERPALVSRRLTHTTGLGVVVAAIDRQRQEVLYGTTEGDLWLLPLSGGDPRPITLPITPSGDAHQGPDGTYWLVDEGAIGRARANGEAERVIDLRDAADGLDPGDSWASPDGTALAMRDESGFRVWDMTEPDREPVRFEMDGKVRGIAWSPDGSRIAATVMPWTARGARLDVFDVEGSLRSSTAFSSIADGAVSVGMAWLPSAMVVLAFDDAEGWVQCLTVTDAGIERGPRSAGMAIRPPTEIIGALADDVLMIRWHEARSRLHVLDRSTAPARVEGSPLDIRRGKGGAVWLSEHELAFLAAEPPGALVKVDLDDVAPHETLALGPFDWASSDGEGGIVAGSLDERTTIQHLAAGATSPRAVPLPGVTLDPPLRCRSPRECLLASAQEPAVLFGVDLERGQVRRRFTCPPAHGCTKGTWAWSAGGQEVFFIHEQQRRLSRFEAETGQLMGEHPPVPPWLIIQSATHTARGELLVTAMLQGSPPDGRMDESYRLLQLHDDGTYRVVWTSPRTWMMRPVASPSGQRVALEGLTFHSDLLAVELGSLCEPPA